MSEPNRGKSRNAPAGHCSALRGVPPFCAVCAFLRPISLFPIRVHSRLLPIIGFVVKPFCPKKPMNRPKANQIVVNPPWPSGRTHSARGDEMLRVVAPYVAEMLHLKSLTINRVAGVAGFQTM